MKAMVKMFALFLVTMAPSAHAAWHGGRLYALNIAYDGSTVAFTIEGYVRSDCTCYPTWSNSLCLDRTRVSFREEMAMLLSAKARGANIYVNINETSCKVEAMYEAD